jgi:hypothetical protein
MSQELPLPFNLITPNVPLVLKYQFDITLYLVTDKYYDDYLVHLWLSMQQKCIL